MDNRPKHARTYNQRLFSGGIRSFFHFARFNWVRSELKRLRTGCNSVLELGCYDGRLIDYLPHRPARYVGLDANWEDGLTLARAKYGHDPAFTFRCVHRPEELNLGDERFRLAFSLETLEHVPPEMVDAYLEQIARHLTGYFIVTVPNETGPVFLTKWLAKKLFRMSPKEYTAAEVLNAFLGRTNRVRRLEHKGFNYRDMIKQIHRHFDVIQVRGFPLSFLPTCLCFGVGITAQSKR